jgi:hypothetical protein
LSVILLDVLTGARLSVQQEYKIMSVTKPSQGTHFSDGVRVGPIIGSIFTPGANVLSPSTQVSSPVDSLAPGIYMTPTSLLDIIPATAGVNNIATAFTPVAGSFVPLVTVSAYGITYLTSYAGVSNVLKLDCARNISITGVVGVTSQIFTVFGWDQYGQPLTEEIQGPVGATTRYGNKAFLYIQSVYVAAGTAAAITVGTGNTFGLPYLMAYPNYSLNSITWAGIPDLTYYTSLAANPIATVITSGVVTVTVTSTANLRTGQYVTISNATAVGGITASQLNITDQITVTSGTTFTYQTYGIATATVAAGGGTFAFASTFNPGEQLTATAITSDVRGTYTSSGMGNAADIFVADGLKRLTINMYNASGDTRNYNAGLNGTLILNANPFTTINTSQIVLVSAPNHQLTTGENVTFTGATTTNGIVAASLNITAAVTVFDQNNFIFTAPTAATANGVGGGVLVSMTPGLGNLYQTTAGRFGVTQYSVAQP